MESYKYSFETGLLSVDQRRGILTLIPKKDKDRTSLSNWRPLSLLNFDYKLLAKVIAERMKKYLQKLIDPDQTGYIENRYIGENLRLIADTIFYTALKDQPGIILLVDFEKAFDTIEWNFIQKTLSSFNFGETFKKWVRILYTDISSIATNNGYSSSPFCIERGVRQGCPLSPFLFILASELLAINIRKNSDISGIKIGDVELKISQLADDTSCFFKDEDSAKVAFDIFKDFEKCSGLKVNFSKTEAAWIGKNKFNRDGSLPIKWTCTFKTLGLHFDVENEYSNVNLDVCIEKMKGVIKTWKARNLTLIGKIVILKSLAISKLIYVISSSSVPDLYITKIQQIIDSFIWNDGTHKIKREVLQKPIKDGGLKAPNFDLQLLSLRIMWIKRFLSEKDANWKGVSRAFFPLFDLKDIFYSRCVFDSFHFEIPSFYTEVLLAWRRFKSLFVPKDLLSIRKECIWFNPFIKINQNTLFYSSWYKKGIKFINDLVNENGDFLSHDELNAKFGINATFIDVYSLRSAIPRQWKSILFQENHIYDSATFKIILDINNQYIPVCKLTSKIIYSIFLDQSEVSVISKGRWEESFNVEISKQKWEQIYSLPFKCVIESKVQALQYKILHRIAAHNYLLKKYEMIDCNKCFKCNSIETLEHKFYECFEMKLFWKKFEEWWFIIFEERLYLRKDCVIFGFLNIEKNVLNFCILMAKYYINLMKSLYDNTHNIPFESFYHFLKRRLDYLEYLYLLKDKSNIFHETFGKLIDSL